MYAQPPTRLMQPHASRGALFSFLPPPPTALAAPLLLLFALHPPLPSARISHPLRPTQPNPGRSRTSRIPPALPPPPSPFPRCSAGPHVPCFLFLFESCSVSVARHLIFCRVGLRALPTLDLSRPPGLPAPSRFAPSSPPRRVDSPFILCATPSSLPVRRAHRTARPHDVRRVSVNSKTEKNEERNNAQTMRYDENKRGGGSGIRVAFRASRVRAAFRRKCRGPARPRLRVPDARTARGRMRRPRSLATRPRRRPRVEMHGTAPSRGPSRARRAATDRTPGEVRAPKPPGERLERARRDGWPRTDRDPEQRETQRALTQREQAAPGLRREVEGESDARRFFRDMGRSARVHKHTVRTSLPAEATTRSRPSKTTTWRAKGSTTRAASARSELLDITKVRDRGVHGEISRPKGNLEEDRTLPSRRRCTSLRPISVLSGSRARARAGGRDV